MTPGRAKLGKSGFMGGRSRVQVWAKFEMYIQYPGEDVKWAGRSMRLELQRRDLFMWKT